ncbi:transglycosylase family protein [Candidatus Dojkabacteria bacterium]|nr:transglycosylase family protein [Candidatus Dojkabacteria bacterium]
MQHNPKKTRNLNWLIIVCILVIVLGAFSLGMIQLRQSFAYVNISKPKASSISTQEVLPAAATKPSTIHSCKYWFKKVDKVTVKGTKKNVWMRYIMSCESGCNPTANTSNKYFGLYNFTKATYKGKGGKNIFDGKEQIRIVSKMYDRGSTYRAQQFPGCNRAFLRDWNKSHK